MRSGKRSAVVGGAGYPGVYGEGGNDYAENYCR